jgi:hypothetical protein
MIGRTYPPVWPAFLRGPLQSAPKSWFLSTAKVVPPPRPQTDGTSVAAACPAGMLAAQARTERTEMTWIITARDRLREANGLVAVLDAAYDAFEGMLAVIGASPGHAESLFAAFGKSAASAAQGRNAILLAPSLPPHCLHVAPVSAQDSHQGESAESIAASIALLSELLADRLAHAARSAPDYRDRAACRTAARRACGICALLAGARL